MKKKIIILGFASLLGVTQYSVAGENNPLRVKCFETDGTITYDVKGCIPGSDISFYSTQGGGEMMNEVTVNATGNARVVWSRKNAPAFVLNVLSTNAAGIAGNGMVTFIGDKEFTVNDVALDNGGGNVTLRWNGAVNNVGNYTFQVLKSVNGGNWSVVQTVNAQSTALMPYSFTDQSESNASAIYELRVIDGTNEVYYTSNVLAADGSNGINVYPTVAHSTINILQNDTRNSSYRIMNMLGQVMVSGELSNTMNTCSVAGLPAGNYLVEVSNASSKTTAKIIKE